MSSLQKDADAAIRAHKENDSFNKFVALVSNHGGISCLTIFNNTWHAKNTNAAKLGLSKLGDG